MPTRHVAIATAVAVIWGVNFVVIHVGLDHFPPLLFAALRFFLVALALPFVPRPGVPVRYVIAVGVFLSAGQFSLLFIGMDQGMPAGLASLVLQLQAAFTVGLAVLLLGERPHPAQLAGGIIALTGIGLIAAGRASVVPLGALALTIGAAFSWGLGNVATRKARSPNPLGLLVWSSLVPPLPLLSLSLLTERGEAVSTRPDRRARAALRRRPLHPARLRRLGLAAGPAPGLDRGAVHVAGAGHRDRDGVDRAGGGAVGDRTRRLRDRARRVGAHCRLDRDPAPGESSRVMRASWFAAAAAFFVIVAAAPAQAAQTTYRVDDVRTAKQRAAVARTGAAIVEVDHGSVTVTAARSDLAALKRAGFKVVRSARKSDFPSADSAYHNFAEMTNEINAVVAANPSLVSQRGIGTTYQGRNLVAIKISDNVAVDEAEPEVLFTCGQHAREHLTIEMCLYLLNSFVSDPVLRPYADTREIWIVPNLNPDGAEYDIATGSYRSWRKNRQPNSGSSAIGTDLNRNWSFQWGCCGGSSGTFSSETYRGPSAFSAPETQRVRDFVISRVVNNVQQITAHIDFHTYSELILWPYGYTTANTAPGLNANDQAALSELARDMAATNGYTPEQASDLYIADGTIDDWMWGVYRIASYTFEMYPRSSNPGFYPPGSVITREVQRNRAAVSILLDAADCLYEVIGQTCGPVTPPLYLDTFETATGWTTNPLGTDTATTGQWARGNPQGTNSSGVKQLDATVSGVNDLATGPTAGADAGAQDIDGGVTTIQSPPITLTGSTARTLSFSWYLAHGTNSSTADYLRVFVVNASGVATQAFQQLGAASNRNGAWATANYNLANFAGQTVRIRIQAADASTASLVEAGIDDVRISG